MRVKIVYKRPPAPTQDIGAAGKGWALPWGARTALGLDLGSDSLKWVLLRSGLRPQVLGSGAIPVKADLAEHLVELRGLLAGQPPGAVVAGLSASRCYFQRVSLPFQDQRRLQAALPFELEQHLPRPIEGLSLDSLPFDGGCTAVALDPQEFLLLREQLAVAGLGARVLEPDLLAAVRSLLLSRDRWPEAGRTALIDLGHGKTSFALFEKGQVVQLGSLRGGLGGLIEALAERDALSEEDARGRLQQSGLESFSAGRTMLSARYARLRLALRPGRREPLELVLTGGGALVPGLDQALGQELGAPAVHVMDAGGLGPAYAAAWGLAQRGLSRSVPASLRLLSAEPETSPFWTRPRRRLAAVLGAMALLLGAVDLHQQIARREQKLAVLEQDLERSFRNLVPEATRVVNAPHQLRVRIEEMERRVGLFPDAGRDPAHPLAVLAAVSGAAPPGVHLDIFSYVQTAEALHLDGEIDNLGAISELRKALLLLPFVSKADIRGTRKAVSSDRVGFQLELALAGASTETPP